MTVELHDYAPEDDESVVVAHLHGLLPEGQVSNSRMTGDPLPFLRVEHVSGEESIEESYLDAVVMVDLLFPRGLGNANRLAATHLSRLVHRRMLLLNNDLPPVEVEGRIVDVQSCSVFTPWGWAPHLDEKILRKMARYRLSLDYARIPKDIA